MVQRGLLPGGGGCLQLFHDRLQLVLAHTVPQLHALLFVQLPDLFQLLCLHGDGLLVGIMNACGGGRFLSLDLGSLHSLTQPPFEPPVLPSEPVDCSLEPSALLVDLAGHMHRLDWLRPDWRTPANASAQPAR